MSDQSYLNDSDNILYLNGILQKFHQNDNNLDYLDSIFLKEISPFYKSIKNLHPALLFINFGNSEDCFECKPHEWFNLIISFKKIGLPIFSVTIFCLMLLCDTRWNYITNSKSKLKISKISKLLLKFQSYSYYELIENTIKDCLSSIDKKSELYYCLSSFVKPEENLSKNQTLKLVVNNENSRKEIDNFFLEKKINISNLSDFSQNQLVAAEVSLRDHYMQSLTDGLHVIISYCVAFEFEFRRIAYDSFCDTSVIDDLNHNSIRARYNQGPEGLYGYAILIKNFDFLSNDSKSKLSGFKKLSIHPRKDVFVDFVIDLSKYRKISHGISSKKSLKNIHDSLYEKKILHILCDSVKT